MIDNNIGRTWSNAPSIVRDARLLAGLGAVISGLVVMTTIFVIVTHGISVTVVILLLVDLFFPFYIWLMGAFKRGDRAAYYIQMVISIIGVTGFPIGTLINGFILYKWFRPDTKAWFGV